MAERTADTPTHRTADSGHPVSGRLADRLGIVFYAAVAAVALAGQALAAVHWLHWPLIPALIATAVVELGAIALVVRADFRRRLGERAIAARILSAAVAAFAVVFQWFGHAGLAAGFFAGMSALGYTVWLINAGDRRRDQLRADDKLPPTPPVYEVWQWVRHPLITARARAMAKADPDLGLYGSLAAAEQAIRVERRTRAIAKTLRKKIAAAAGPQMAKIAVNTYDLSEVAKRLAASADYDGLTALIAADLAADRLAPSQQPAQRTRVEANAPLSGSAATLPRPDAKPDSHAAGRPDRSTAGRVVSLNGRKRTVGSGRRGVTVEQLADTVDDHYKGDLPMWPTVRKYLVSVYGSCSNDRAREAMELVSARRSAREADSDAEERQPEPVGASA